VKVEETSLPGVVTIEPAVFGDDRGYFLETYRKSRYADRGVDVDFVQDNLSRSARGTIRGLHLQHPSDQAKLVWVIEGEVLDVAVDVRVGSPTFGRHVAVPLDAGSKRQLFIPTGFAHGFLVRSEAATFAYKCSADYSADDAIDIAWDDPQIGIDWGITEPLLSEKDADAPRLDEVMARLPRWKA
jgi:dTDP-4-dehydrorhamnose 3,5-epimerase